MPDIDAQIALSSSRGLTLAGGKRARHDSSAIQDTDGQS